MNQSFCSRQRLCHVKWCTRFPETEAVVNHGHIFLFLKMLWSAKASSNVTWHNVCNVRGFNSRVFWTWTLCYTRWKGSVTWENKQNDNFPSREKERELKMHCVLWLCCSFFSSVNCQLKRKLVWLTLWGQMSQWNLSKVYFENRRILKALLYTNWPLFLHVDEGCVFDLCF